MAIIALANPTVIVNNIHIAVVPNSVSYTEGFGAQTMRIRSGGGGAIETVYTENVETNYSKIKFGIHSDVPYLELARGWKVLKNANVIELLDNQLEFNRIFRFCALITDYDIALGQDSTIELEFHGTPAI